MNTAKLTYVLASTIAFKEPSPHFRNTPTNVTFVKGGLAVLYCSIENLGTKTVIWRKQPYEVPITVGNEQFVLLDRFYLSHVPHKEEWNLYIKNVQPFDAGIYECQVSSKKKTIRRNITLHVRLEEQGHTSKPMIQINGTRFVEKGQPIILNCTATGNDSPMEDIDWFKDGNLLTTRNRPNLQIQKQIFRSSNTIVSLLHIRNTNMGDTGTYICRTSRLLATRYKVDVLNSEKYPYKRENEQTSEGNSSSYSSRNNSSFCFHVYFVHITIILARLFDNAVR